VSDDEIVETEVLSDLDRLALLLQLRLLEYVQAEGIESSGEVRAISIGCCWVGEPDNGELAGLLISLELEPALNDRWGLSRASHIKKRPSKALAEELWVPGMVIDMGTCERSQPHEKERAKW
jgi:hypothetical protein